MTRSPRPSWAEQTLAELGGATRIGGEDTHLNAELRRLQSVPLTQLRIEDLRLLVSQARGLPFIVPIALDHLKHHPLAAGDFYRGDLLRSLMAVDETFWRSYPKLRTRLVAALEQALVRVRKVRTVPSLESELNEGLARHRAACERAV